MLVYDLVCHTVKVCLGVLNATFRAVCIRYRIHPNNKGLLLWQTTQCRPQVLKRCYGWQ